MLDDGTRLPHYLGTTRTDPRVLDSDNFNNYAIRIGEVVAIHYPDDPTNRTKREIEYTVNVQYRRGNGPPVNTPYHCTVADPLGTAGDSSRQTLRASRGEKAGDSLTDGARVLIACPNGETSSAVIISGVKHHRAARDPVRANGDYLSRFFNGVEIAINDQGELSITNHGATLNDGSPDDKNRDTHNQGTQVVFPMDGSVIIDNKAGDTVKIDTTNRRIFIGTKDMATEPSSPGPCRLAETSRSRPAATFRSARPGRCASAAMARASRWSSGTPCSRRCGTSSRHSSPAPSASSAAPTSFRTRPSSQGCHSGWRSTATRWRRIWPPTSSPNDSKAIFNPCPASPTRARPLGRPATTTHRPRRTAPGA
jgi:hypothetical protein